MLQLDGTTIKTIGVIKDLGLKLHVFPNFSIPQEVFVIDLPPYFSLCLSRDFTAKIGCYLSSDWSHILFRTRYGTRVTIRSKSLAKDHIEPYMSSIVNINTFISQEDELAATHELQSESVPEMLSNEWETQNVIDNLDK